MMWIDRAFPKRHHDAMKTNVSSGTWADAEGNAWEWTLEWDVLDGRVECVGFRLRAIPFGRSPGPRPQLAPGQVRPLTASVLRQFPLGSTVANARGRQQKMLKRLRRAAPGHEKAIDARLAEWERQRSVRPGRKGYGADHYSKVAEIYREAAALGNAPTRAVAEHFVVSKSAAAKWVARARGIGLLPPTQRGKAR